jgi:hypothetical protein
MIHKLAEFGTEAAEHAAIFVLTFLLATGLTCNGRKVSCDQPRDEAAEVRTP